MKGDQGVVWQVKRAFPCPCCSCNKGVVPITGTLAEEAHAEAHWYVFGCPNNPPTHEYGTQLIVRYFDRRRISRGAAWRFVDDGQAWRKIHTARTWCWYLAI